MMQGLSSTMEQTEYRDHASFVSKNLPSVPR
jgi:hypothetical protein